MANLESKLILSLVDQVTGPAKSVAEALKKSESQIKAIDDAFKNSGASSKFQQQLASIGRSSADIDRVANAWRQYAASIGAAGDASKWTKEQASAINTWERNNLRSIRSVEAAERAYQRQHQQLADARLRTAERASERAGVGHMVRNGVLAYTGAHAVMHGGKYAIEQGAETAHELAAIQCTSAHARRVGNYQKARSGDSKGYSHVYVCRQLEDD
jgi:hypothetical protein